MTISIEDAEVISAEIDEKLEETRNQLLTQIDLLMKRVARLERTPSDPLS
jgi:hypothetical protein